MEKVYKWIKRNNVLWINAILFLVIYSVYIFIDHYSVDSFHSYYHSTADMNLRNGRIFNWLIYYIQNAIGIPLYKDLFVSQLILIFSMAIASNMIYKLFIREVKETPLNKALVHIGSVLIFANICFYEGWMYWPESVFVASFNILACYGGVALFAKGYAKRRIIFRILSYFCAAISIFGYQVYVSPFITLCAMYVLCHCHGKIKACDVLCIIEMVAVAALISLLTIYSMKLLVELGYIWQVDRVATFDISTIFENLNKIATSIQVEMWKDMLDFMPQYAMPAMLVITLLCIVAFMWKKTVPQLFWIAVILLGCYVSVFLPHIVTSNIWPAPRTLFGLFCFIGGCLFLIANIRSMPVKVFVCIVTSVFVLISFVRIQELSVDNIASNRIDQLHAYEIQHAVNEYEAENGVDVTVFAVRNDGNPRWANDTISFTKYDTNVRIYSVAYSTIHALNYYTGESFDQRDMTDEEYARHFNNAEYHHFDVDDLLKFEGDTAFLLIN